MDQTVKFGLDTHYLEQDTFFRGGKSGWSLYPSESAVHLTCRPYYWCFKQFSIALHSSNWETFCLSQMQNASHLHTPCHQFCIWDIVGESYLQIISAHPGTKLIDPAGKISFLPVYKQFYPPQAVLLAVHPCTSLGAQYQCMDEIWDWQKTVSHLLKY